MHSCISTRDKLISFMVLHMNEEDINVQDES